MHKRTVCVEFMHIMAVLKIFERQIVLITLTNFKTSLDFQKSLFGKDMKI